MKLTGIKIGRQQKPNQNIFFMTARFYGYAKFFEITYFRRPQNNKEFFHRNSFHSAQTVTSMDTLWQRKVAKYEFENEFECERSTNVLETGEDSKPLFDFKFVYISLNINEVAKPMFCL